ncbi:MAG: hypothetical protein DMG65_02770 [Candidatus Angelobacter sp. Gp1-AA117]|nr:MAG: hypothetical protein DMG65_02770 [Candidatus Angelobacter sp. Gp1-AA117]
MKLLSVVSALLALTMAASACTVVLPAYKVQPSFDVLISYGKKPMPGIKVVLYQSQVLDHSFITSVSNENGIVNIKNLAPGKYLIDVEDLGGGSSAELEVQKVQTWESRQQISLSWPAGNSVQTRNLRGRLVPEDGDRSYAGMDLKLWKPGASGPLAVTKIGKDGSFAFDTTEPATYVLELVDPRKSASKNKNDIATIGFIPVDVISSGGEAPDKLELALGESSCGLTYSHCLPGAPIAISSRAFHVVDSMGAVIRSSYRLVGSNHRPLSLETNTSGEGAIPSDITGPGELVIQALGFVSLHQNINLLAADPRAPALKVMMAVQGPGAECSKAFLETNAPQK